MSNYYVEEPDDGSIFGGVYYTQVMKTIAQQARQSTRCPADLPLSMVDEESGLTSDEYLMLLGPLKHRRKCIWLKYSYELNNLNAQTDHFEQVAPRLLQTSFQAMIKLLGFK